MIENTELPRYTWIGDTLSVSIMKRIGVYGQQQILTLWPSATEFDNDTRKQILVLAANALCDYFENRDRDAAAAEKAGKSGFWSDDKSEG